MASAYATRAQLIERYDARLLGDLVGDAGTRVSSGDLLTNDNLQRALDDASGAIDAAMRSGDRYTVDNLRALIDDNTTSADAKYGSAMHLVRVTCDIAIMYLSDRRLFGGGDNPTLQRVIERAKQYIEDLRSGRDIFDIGNSAEVGKVQVSGPTTAQLDNLNLVTRNTLRYYPNRPMPFNR